MTSAVLRAAERPIEADENEATSSGAQSVRVTVNLPEGLAQELRARADNEGKTFTQLLKEAIGLKLYIDRAVADGSTVLIETQGRPLRELVFQG